MESILIGGFIGMLILGCIATLEDSSPANFCDFEHQSVDNQKI